MANLTAEQTAGLQKVLAELQARQAAGTPSNQARSGVVATTPVAPTTSTSSSATQPTTTPASTSYVDPKTGNTYPSKQWMVDNIKNLPEVQNAYPELYAPKGTTNVATLGTGSGTSNIPDTSKTTPTVDTSGTPDTTAYYQAQLDEVTKQKEELSKSQQKTTGTTTTGQAGVAEAIANQPTLDPATIRANAEKEAGLTTLQDTLTQGLTKVASYKAELQSIEDTRNAETANARNRFSSMENISADINEINYKYDLQKAAKTALMNTELFQLDVVNGQITNAQNRIADIVNDYTASYKAEVDKQDKLATVYSNWISDLNDDEKTILNNAHEEAVKALDTAKEDATNVLNMMMKYPNAGIVLTDTPESAAKKVTKYEKDNPKINTSIVGSAETGYQLVNSDTGEIIKQISSGTGTTNNNIFSEVSQAEIDDGLTQEINSGADALQAATLYINGQTTTFTEKEKTAILNRAKEIKKSIDDANNSNITQDPNNPNASILKGYNPFITGLTNALFK